MFDLLLIMETLISLMTLILVIKIIFTSKEKYKSIFKLRCAVMLLSWGDAILSHLINYDILLPIIIFSFSAFSGLIDILNWPDNEKVENIENKHKNN